MRILVTGLKGTLAPVLAETALRAGHHVLGWDRERVPPHDAAFARAFLDAGAPEAIAHLATGSEAWAGLLAGWAAARRLPFVFTSSAMVFHHEPDGPHRPQDERTARDDYGRSKIRSEDAVLAAHPGASVVRIGWQIDPARGGNNMLAQLDEQQRRDGHLGASRAWKPACSFMDDTARALLALIEQPLPGCVHVDSNADEGHGFDRVVAALKHAFGRDTWQLRVHEDYRHDQRLAGGVLTVPPLSSRLPLLREG